MEYKAPTYTVKTPQWIENVTAMLWLKTGTIQVIEYGNENTYYEDQFGNEFYCKNYPDDYGSVSIEPWN